MLFDWCGSFFVTGAPSACCENSMSSRFELWLVDVVRSGVFLTESSGDWVDSSSPVPFGSEISSGETIFWVSGIT